MAVTTRFPTSNTAYSGAGFTNPNNLHADDGVYGTAAPAKNNGLGNAYTGFGFDSQIPSGSTISAVKIIYEFKVSTTGSVAIQRVKARIGGVEEENHDNTTEPASDTVITVDITADRTWTRDNLLDATFEVIAEARRGNNNTAYTASWDQVKVEVTYTAPTPTRGLVSFAELESPSVALTPTRGLISWTELEAQLANTRGLISFTELEIPTSGPQATRGLVSWGELEAPLVLTRGLISRAELQTGLSPTRGMISWMALEVPGGTVYICYRMMTRVG